MRTAIGINLLVNGFGVVFFFIIPYTGILICYAIQWLSNIVILVGAYHKQSKAVAIVSRIIYFIATIITFVLFNNDGLDNGTDTLAVLTMLGYLIICCYEFFKADEEPKNKETNNQTNV